MCIFVVVKYVFRLLNLPSSIVPNIHHFILNLKKLIKTYYFIMNNIMTSTSKRLKYKQYIHIRLITLTTIIK